MKDEIRSVHYFLNEVLDNSCDLDIRKEEMLRVGSKFCQGFPSWSDFFGRRLESIDDLSKDKLREILENIK